MKHQYLSVAEVCQLLRICRTTAYKLRDQGTLEFFKLGSKTLVTRASVDSVVPPAAGER